MICMIHYYCHYYSSELVYLLSVSVSGSTYLFVSADAKEGRKEGWMDGKERALERNQEVTGISGIGLLDGKKYEAR
jgi:hypothetical protein